MLTITHIQADLTQGSFNNDMARSLYRILVTATSVVWVILYIEILCIEQELLLAFRAKCANIYIT